MLWVFVMGLATVPAFAAEESGAEGRRQGRQGAKAAAVKEEPKPKFKDAPSEREILRAQDRVKHYMSDRAIRGDFKDGRMIFTPADLGGLSDEQMANGFILGYVETDREKTDSGMTADPNGKLRTYVVYARKVGRGLERLVRPQGQAVAKSPLVDDGLDNVHPPVWQNSKRARSGTGASTSTSDRRTPIQSRTRAIEWIPAMHIRGSSV